VEELIGWLKNMLVEPRGKSSQIASASPLERRGNSTGRKLRSREPLSPLTSNVKRGKQLVDLFEVVITSGDR
jgi:hypothetical protein